MILRTSWWVLKNEGGQLVPGVDHAVVTTSLARLPNPALVGLHKLGE